MNILAECKDCRFYSENWCYDKGVETEPNAQSCSKGVYDEEVCESIMPDGDDCPGKPEYYADPVLVYCKECTVAMIKQWGSPGTIYRKLPNGTTVEVNVEELIK